MKKFLNAFAAGTAVAALGLGAGAAQAADATATATAEILEQITIASARDLSFGTIVPSAAASTVGVAANAGGALTCGAGLTCAGTPTSAQFDVTGSAGYTVDITDNGSSATLSNGTDTMPVSFAFSAASFALDGSGNGTFYVGGTLNVGANQPVGVYTGSVEVSANYQ